MAGRGLWIKLAQAGGCCPIDRRGSDRPPIKAHLPISSALRPITHRPRETLGRKQPISLDTWGASLRQEAALQLDGPAESPRSHCSFVRVRSAPFLSIRGAPAVCSVPVFFAAGRHMFPDQTVILPLGSHVLLVLALAPRSPSGKGIGSRLASPFP
ncbi:hypothetical protein AAFF_G00341300 [Aldrovandia affinis]|uniref:Uncharacterized protein n=1 Tax=Aldrovandia affinis TaxID=143900 RepID=A0AAD7SKL3_9TELE|nr:hypothetical protein AAFF_G00341300 [Aldrovandia affinis]